MVPNQGYVSVSRRPLDVEDYIDIMRRYRSWIVGPLFAGLVISVVVAFLWPDTYVSSAVMRITPPQVPERLVPSNINLQIGERLAAMQTDITSRTSLSDLITQPALDLYKKQRNRQPLEDVIDKMRKDIKIFILADPNRADNRQASAFQISFRYTDRYKAQLVVGRLVSKFMEQNLSVQRTQSQFTTSFMSDEAQVAKQNLDRIDQELTQFRIQNAGRLPEQLATNLQTLNALQMQLGSVTESLNRNAQEKLLLDNSLQNYKHQLNFMESNSEELAVVQAQKNERLTQLNRTILDTETHLAAARESLREDHPDIRSMKATLNVLKRERDALEKQEQAKAQDTPGQVEKRRNPQVAKSIEDMKAYISSIEAQIRIKDLDMAEKTKRQTELHKDIERYQGLISTSPINEQKYLALEGEYKLAKQRYEEMTQRKAISETAGKLEERKAGENLEVVDPPSLPEQPTDPQRIVIAAVGVGLGLIIGVFLAGAKEMKDTSLKNLKDVRAYTNLAVLSSIPLLENALLVRRKRRLFWLAWSTAVIVGLIAMSGSMYYYYFGRA